MRPIFLALALVSGAAVAEEQTSPPTSAEQERVAVQAWGKAHPACREWSDSCVVCTQDGCSTPGIACTPTQTACRR